MSTPCPFRRLGVALFAALAISLFVVGTAGAQTTLFRINAGGPALGGASGWQADAPSASPYVNTGNAFAASVGIDLTDPSIPAGTPEALFQSERWDSPSSPEMQWDFPVTPGTYEVRLYFAEIYGGAQTPGARVFDVLIEGSLVLDDYDVYSDVGADAGVVKTFVVAADVTLDIDFVRGEENPAIKGIEIIPGGAGRLGVSPTSVAFGTVSVGTSAVQSVQLTNSGSSGAPAIEVQSTAIGGAVAFNDNFSGPATLAPGESVSIDVTFAPTATGSQSATLQINHDGANAPTSVALAGTGESGGSGGSEYRINAGGPALGGASGWQADAPSASPYVNTGNAFAASVGIDLTDPSIPAGTPEALFQSERWDSPSSPEMQWDFPVTPGTYEVRLYFAEIYGGAQTPGARVFDVLIEGSLVLDDYDVYSDVGADAGVVKTFVVAADVTLDIDFVRGEENPAIKGIEIIPGGAGRLGVSPTSVAFGTVSVGTSAVQSVQLTNSGSSGAPAIEVQSTAIGGAVAFNDNFSGPATLAPGESVSIDVTFAPTATGSQSATLQINHDGANAPTSVALAGTGESGGSGGSEYRINAGGPALGGASGWQADAPSASPYVNTGNAFAASVGIDLTDPSIPAGTPEALFQSERWDSPSSPEMQWDFPVTPGTYEVRLYFAEIYGGAQTPGARVFDVLIEGSLVLDDYDVYSDVGADAGVVKTFVVAADVTLDIDFVRGEENPAIKGIEIIPGGAGRLGVSPTSVAFGTVSVGTSAVQSVQLTNSGSSGAPAIEVQSTAIGGAVAFNDNFSGPATLAPGESVSIDVTFAPTATGSQSATLQINHDGANAPTSAALAGTGESGGGPGSSDLGVSSTSVAFGTVSVGTSAVQSVQLTNSGSSGAPAIEVQSTAIGGAVAFNDNFSGPATLAPGESVSIDVTFAPTATGSQSATLQINHDGANAPTSVALAGTGESGGSGGSEYRINAGGPALGGASGWQADAPSASPYVNTGNAFAASVGIDLTDPSIPAGTPEALFQSERWDSPSSPEMQWDFPVTPGTYEVRLYFAEIYGGAQTPGARVFDVLIEGSLVLDDYDVYSDVGADAGVVKTFVVAADVTLDIDFVHGEENPAIKGIEIIPGGAGRLGVSSTSVAFGTVSVGTSAVQSVQLTNSGSSGAPAIEVQSTAIGGAVAFSDNFSGPATLAPGESVSIDVTFAPTTTGSQSATLEVFHDGTNSPIQINLTGGTSQTLPVSFTKSVLSGTGGLTNPTSLQFGPDGRLYVAEQNGVIRAYDVAQNGSNSYSVIGMEVITSIASIPNHNDGGVLKSSVNGRLVTGILVKGTPFNPVIYVNSSDPRIGAGPSGQDLDLDTNSGILSRLTWDGSSWEKLDLVRGLPRSEENHHPNGLYLDEASNLIYFQTGGNTNTGARSNNFALLPEFALSAAILEVDLNVIGETTYDLPTLNDEDRPGTNDANDPFGGNNGKNQAILVPGGPVQVYAPGFRNAYDIAVTEAGHMYTIDNGPNAGWGDVPVNEGPGGFCTNDVNEPGSTYPDTLHLVSGRGYYGGHPNPTRGYSGNVFNTSNPQSPVTNPNPIECDHLVPGIDNPALTTFPASTNGLTEYTAFNFGGAMTGDLLTASFDNKIYRMILDSSGRLLSNEVLFSGVSGTPLDIVAQGDFEFFPGTIWVAAIASNQILVFEPVDQSSCSRSYSTSLDEDVDGFDNADEIDNGTNPCSAADVPPDSDGDLTSDLNDSDDDNDGLADTVDPFAIDPSNGGATNLPVLYTWENDAPSAGGILDLGFTGLMSNGFTDYHDLYDPAKMTAGGAAGVLTIDEISAGDAGNASLDPDTQAYGFQFGINVSSTSQAFTIHTRVAAPFAGITPQDFQSLGLFAGNGDQDNYLKVVLTAAGGFGGIEVARELAGAYSLITQHSLSLPGPDYVDFYIELQPTGLLAQASYQVTSGGATGLRINAGGLVPIPENWLNGSTKLAVGVISTSRGATPFPGTWDFIEVVPQSGVLRSEAMLVIDTGSSIDGSTFSTGSFEVNNQSQGNQRLTRITIDLGTAVLPDLVYDPDGLAGDVVAKGFTPDSGASTVGPTSHQFSAPHDDGYDVLEIDFGDFDVGEQFTFSVDVDPTSIRGSSAPGPNESGSVSGLELVGATITAEFDDGSQHSTELFAVPGSVGTSQNTIKADLPQAPVVQVLGIASTPATVAQASQTVRVSGPVGAEVTVLVVEGGIFTAGVPGGGFDLDPYEVNSAVAVTEYVADVGSAGIIDIPVTLTKSDVNAGLNYITAVVRQSATVTGTISEPVILELSP